MEPKKYSTYYYDINHSIEEIQSIINYHIKYGNTNIFKDHIYCPDCKIAKLSFVGNTNTTAPYIKTKNGNKHDPNCAFDFPYIPKKTIIEYITKLNTNQVKTKLKSMMQQLFPTKSINGIPISIDENEFLIDPSNNSNIIKQKSKTKQIRRQNIVPFIVTKNLKDNTYAFYGKNVRLKVNEVSTVNKKTNEPYTFYNLEIYINDKYRGKIYRGGIKDSIDESKDYNLVCFGQQSQNYPSKLLNIELTTKNSILFD